MTLLTPGPCQTSASVRAAAAQPDLNHRSTGFLELLEEVRSRLLSVYRDTSSGWEALLMGGSGTAMMEAVATSCVRSGPVLVLANGYYSERMGEIFDVAGIPATVLLHPWTSDVDAARVESELERGYEAVFVAHHETTTGRLNDVAIVGRLCKQSGARFFVDAMSSFGAEEIAFADIDGLIASPNKCLHGLPGLSFVLLRQDLLESMSSWPRRTVSLHLPAYAGPQPPFTPPVPVLGALRQALRELEDGGGREARQASYRCRAAEIRGACESAGLEMLIPEPAAACSLSCFSLPEGWTAEQWHRANLAGGYELYRPKGKLGGTHFLVANMGELSSAEIEGWASLVGHLLPDAGKRPQA